jgi:hypothetical protein
MAQPPDPFEFLKNLWGPMGVPLAGLMAPTINLNEIDRRIAELKSVENWLNMNLGVLRMTVQGLEMQKSGFAAMRGTAAKDSTAEESANPDAAASAKTRGPKPGSKDSPQ